MRRIRRAELMGVLQAMLFGALLTSCSDDSPRFECGPQTFTIVGVPDTQGHGTLDKQIHASFRFALELKRKWEETRGREGCNIIFVTGYGDVVETIYGLFGIDQMKNMSEAYNLFQGQIPYHVGVGNHDAWKPFGHNSFDWIPPDKDPELATTFLEHFPPERFIPEDRGGWNEEPLTSRYWSTNMESMGSAGVDTWQIVPTGLEVDGRPLELLHLGLEWGWFSKDAKVLEWAAQRVLEHPGLPVLVTTHVNVGIVEGKPERCGNYFGPDGPSLWKLFLRDTPRVFAALSGHMIGKDGASPECHILRKNSAGFDVAQLYNNYQQIGEKYERGMGYLVYITFDLPKKELRVVVHSADHGFRDALRSDGTRASTLSAEFDLLERVRDPK